MRIQVTEKHIQNGIRNSSRSCPIALALKDAGFPSVGVSIGAIFAESRHFYLNQYNEDKVTDFINNFDYDIEVKPIEFKVKLKRATL